MFPVDTKPSAAMSAPALTLRRANMSRKGGEWQDEDYEVFDGNRNVGRIYLVDIHAGARVGSGASRSRSPSAKATGMRWRSRRRRPGSGPSILPLRAASAELYNGARRFTEVAGSRPAGSAWPRRLTF
jgi:hypothetical protein